MSQPAAWITQLSTSRGSVFEGSCGDSSCEFCAQRRASRAAATTVGGQEPPVKLTVASIVSSVWSVLTGGGQ